MVIRIGGERFYPWRAVDDEGEVLDVLVQRRRNRAAALKLMRRLLKRQGFAPTCVTTDRLRSYGAAFAQLGLSARHAQGLRLNNRAEVSHQPVRGGSTNYNASSSLDLRIRGTSNSSGRLYRGNAA